MRLASIATMISPVISSDAAATVLGVSALGAAIGAGAAHAVPLPLALAGGAAGLAVLAANLAHRRRLTALAASLSATPVAQPLARSLADIADRLNAIGHRSVAAHPTTGLPTREHLIEAIERDCAAQCGVRWLGAIRFADFDRLAAFDLEAANDALARFTERLARAMKPSHVLAQTDRDTFAIWLRGDPAEAAAELRALTYVSSQELSFGESLLTPTIEVGAVSYPADAAHAAHLLLRATASLGRPLMSAGAEYLAPAAPSAEAARQQFALEQDLLQAIDGDELSLAFQPVVNLTTGALVGAEALLRWNHARLGPISPARFMPVVESMGLSDRYGMWVLNAACREARRWRDEGLTGMKIAVNLSARQLLDPGLRAKIERTLDRHGLTAEALELELTETAAMADAERTRALFAELRSLGISLAIDDFGAGYSSLSYLKNLRFDKLKIDREFVTDVHIRSDSRAICNALVQLGKGLNLTVLAEGVESQGEVECLQALGCEIFQGYFFSKPLDAAQFRAMALDSAWRKAPPAAPALPRVAVSR